MNRHIHIRADDNYIMLAAELAKRVDRDTSETIRQAIAFAHGSGAMFGIWLAIKEKAQDEQED